MTDIVMGVGLEHSPEAWAAYSPIDRVTEDAPPMFVIHGDKDVLVPVPIARSFVHLHGGEIWVESELGQGSRFHFIVPAEEVQDRSAGGTP